MALLEQRSKCLKVGVEYIIGNNTYHLCCPLGLGTNHIWLPSLDRLLYRLIKSVTRRHKVQKSGLSGTSGINL